MSTKDNWDDDSSDDEEGCLRSACPDPPQKSDKQNSPPDTPLEDDDAEGCSPPLEEDVAIAEEYPPEDYEWGVEGGDPLDEDDYEDELDAYDKKLGRFVSCR